MVVTSPSAMTVSLSFTHSESRNKLPSDKIDVMLTVNKSSYGFEQSRIVATNFVTGVIFFKT